MTDTTQFQPGPELDEKVCKALGIGRLYPNPRANLSARCDKRSDGEVCQHCGGICVPSGIDGGTWIHCEFVGTTRFPPVSTDWRELHGLLGALYHMFSITVWRHVGVSSVGTGWYVALGRSIHAAHPYSQRQENEWRARSKELPHALCLAALDALSEDRTK